ncbi:colanic acid biosynthesis glycosyltransferase WcaL [Thioflexithrix psekupsensis]|uniref:Colanic acid biosynthesis glycosyltransferase WcaL n=2 Tax=Thioflexithrix psekupsensis TaxID=1570016 RepID=A0A251XAD8_9GAMM|nr:colanic acid biosynthesis glycosyltransferase WcaL [Thioflexithrix psekupsensis]
MNFPSSVRLAYLVSRYPSISHTFILREVQFLRAQGFEIQVISVNAPDRSAAQLTADEQDEMAQTLYIKPAGLRGALAAHWHTLRTRPRHYFRGLWCGLRTGKTDLKRIAYGFFYFVEAVMLGYWMQQRQLTHVHVHFANAAATVALIAARIFPVNYSITVHGPDEFYNTHEFLLTEKIKNATFICCISQFARSQLMAVSSPDHWDKFEISPLGVHSAHFIPFNPREKNAVFTALCVGRLVPVKGQAILIQAVSHLHQMGESIRLYIVGDGPDKDDLKQLVAAQQLTESVFFTGAVNQDKILDYYRQADVFVLASFAEGVPVVLMEAMSMAIPCVTTHITGIPELIGAGQGLLVAPSDSVALANAIKFLMHNPELAQNMGIAAREKVKQHYELATNTAYLGEIFTRRLGHDVELN